MDMCTLLYLKWKTNKDLPYSTGNSVQCYVAAWMAEESGVGWMDTCTAESLHYSPENYHNIGNQLYLNTK